MCRVSAVNPVLLLLLLLFINEYNTWSPLISGKPAGTKSFVYVVYFGHLHFARHEHEDVAAAAACAGLFVLAGELLSDFPIVWRYYILGHMFHYEIVEREEWIRYGGNVLSSIGLCHRRCRRRVVPWSDDRPSVTCTRMDCLTATHPHWLAGMKLIGLLPLSDLKNHLSTENYTITLIKMVKGLGARGMKEDLSN